MKKNSLYILYLLSFNNKTEGSYNTLDNTTNHISKRPTVCHYLSQILVPALICAICFNIYNHNIYENMSIETLKEVINITKNNLECLSTTASMPFCNEDTPYRQNTSFMIPVSNYYINKYVSLVPTNMTEFMHNTTTIEHFSNPLDTDNLFFGLGTVLMAFLTVFFNQFYLFAKEEINKIEKWVSCFFFYLFSLGDIGVGITYIVDSIKNNNNSHDQVANFFPSSLGGAATWVEFAYGCGLILLGLSTLFTRIASRPHLKNLQE